MGRKPTSYQVQTYLISALNLPYYNRYYGSTWSGKGVNKKLTTMGLSPLTVVITDLEPT